MLHPGQTIGGYRIDALLGKGAMGEVYQGEQLSLGRPVAIKRIAEHLLDEGDALSRFEREAKCVAALADPHIIAVYDFGLFTDADGEGQVLLIMELVTGGRSLKQLLQPDEPLSWQEATALCLQMARGLATAHEQGVVHRDIKPDNVLLNIKGIAKLADFGLARGAESTALTAAGNMLGTPNYMSPEACQGEPVGPAGDVYSLGASWYHLVAGRPPFVESNLMALVHAHCQKQAQPIVELQPAMPKALADLLMRCLSKDPVARPGAQELVDTIATAGGDQLPGDLRDLCRRGGMTTDPSTIGTTVDPEAATVRNGQAATVATAVQAGAEAATLPTAQAPAPEAETLPTAHGTPAPQSQAAADELHDHRPLPTWMFVPLMLLVLAIIVGWLFFSEEPLEGARKSIDGLLAADQVATALTTADAFIIMYPSEPGGHELLRTVVEHEALALARQRRYDDALSRLDEHRAERKWLDTALIRRDVQLQQAADAVADGQLREAELIFSRILEALPRDVHSREACLQQLINARSGEATRVRLQASTELLELQQPAQRKTVLYDTLLALLNWRTVDSESTAAVRAELLAHHRAASLAWAVECLGSKREDVRRHGITMLREAGELTGDQELRYHLRNLTELGSTSRGRLEDAMAYVRSQAAEADWHQRLAAAGFARIDEIRALNSWSDFHDKLRAACVTALAEELRPWALAAVAQRGDEAAHDWRGRWNAYLFLKESGALGEVDVDGFHRTSITVFSPWYADRCFDTGRDHFAAQLEGPKAAAARAALEASREHIRSERARAVADGQSTTTIDENLASVERLLTDS